MMAVLWGTFMLLFSWGSQKKCALWPCGCDVLSGLSVQAMNAGHLLMGFSLSASCLATAACHDCCCTDSSKRSATKPLCILSSHNSACCRAQFYEKDGKQVIIMTAVPLLCAAAEGLL